MNEAAVEALLSAQFRWLALAALLVSLALYLILRWASRARSGDERGLPAELLEAEVVSLEHTFRSHRFGLVARIDRAYKVGASIVLVEFKTRSQLTARMTDVIEMSVQRLALADETGLTVAPFAWVLVQQTQTKRRVPLRVPLLNESQVMAFRRRHQELVGAEQPTSEPRGVEHRAMCRNCGHREICYRRFGVPN